MSLSWPIPERASDYFGDYFSFREKAGDSLVSVILSVISLEKAGDSFSFGDSNSVSLEKAGDSLVSVIFSEIFFLEKAGDSLFR